MHAPICWEYSTPFNAARSTGRTPFNAVLDRNDSVAVIVVVLLLFHPHLPHILPPLLLRHIRLRLLAMTRPRKRNRQSAKSGIKSTRVIITF